MTQSSSWGGGAGAAEGTTPPPETLSTGPEINTNISPRINTAYCVVLMGIQVW